MAKETTTAELARMAKKGTVKFDPEDTNIARFGELIDKLNELISLKAKETAADLARSQVQLEILGALQKSVTQQKRGVTKSHAIDLGPLQQILEELQASRMVAWEFDIQRGAEGGPMQRVLATPIPPTRH